MVKTRIIEKRRTTPVLIATSGDSKANTSLTNTDTSLVDIAFPASGATVVALNGNKLQTHLHYPRARLVANGGVSGETTTQWLARDAAGAGATRKAITDILNLRADVAIVDVGANDFATVTSGTRAAAVATAVANAKIGLSRLALGCSCVIFRPQGSNNAGATDLAQTRLACLEYNAAIEAFIETFGYGRMFYLESAFVNPDGSIPAAYTYDGIHQSWTGGMIEGKAEAAILTRLYGISDRRRFDGVGQHAVRSQCQLVQDVGAVVSGQEAHAAASCPFGQPAFISSARTLATRRLASPLPPRSAGRYFLNSGRRSSAVFSVEQVEMMPET